MVRQQFKTTDFLRFEVETDPAGLVNMVQNPNGEFGGWGWITPAPVSQITGDGEFLSYGKAASGASYFTTEAMPMPAGKWVAARWQAWGPIPGWTGASSYRVRFEWLDSNQVLLSSSAQVGPWALSAGGAAFAVQAPASTSFVRLRFDLYAGGVNPVNPHGIVISGVTVAKADTAGELDDDGELPYIAPVEYLNILPDSHEVRVPRKELDVGRLSAVIYSQSLDPSQSTLIRPGRRARLTALVDGKWETLIGGKILEASVTYNVKDRKVPDGKRARVEVTIVDAAQPLTNTKRPDTVATINQLPFVLEGAGVPWNVNGSGSQVVASTVVSVNDGASALDQVALTRDTALGYAWVSRLGVLNVWDRAEIASGAPLLIDEDDYSDIDLSFSTKDCINEVTVVVQAVGPDSATVETTYGPYRDVESIAEWGAYSKTFTVAGLAEGDVAAYAAAVLSAAAVPRIRVNSITLPLSTVAQLEGKALIDLYDEVRVVLVSRGVDDTLRVTGIEHIIDTDRWLLRLDFSDEGGVASPTIQPPVQSGVTLAQLLRPVGEVTMWVGAKADIPAGWLPLDGSAFDGDAYPALEDLLGGTTLPDFTDRFPIGAGSKALGTFGGSPTVTLTTGQLPPHAHGIPRSASTGTDATFARGGTFGTTIASDSTGDGDPIDILNPWLAVWFIVRAA